MLDSESNLALYWIRDAAELPWYESAMPLRSILYWWMRQRGFQFVHAAAVGMRSGGVLLAGKAGSGKSTTALACLGSGLLYAGDDYCLLSSTPGPYAHSLYSSGKADALTLRMLPHLEKAIHNANRLDTEKAILFLQRYHPEWIVTGFPIRAILVPRITGRQTTVLTPAPAATALKTLAPSTIFQLSGGQQSAFRAIAECVRQVPCYYLEVGTELSKIPGFILDLLSRLQ